MVDKKNMNRILPRECKENHDNGICFQCGFCEEKVDGQLAWARVQHFEEYLEKCSERRKMHEEMHDETHDEISSEDEAEVSEEKITKICELCGKDEDRLMCDACQARYLKKIPHRNLVTCAHGHIYAMCPNSTSYRRTGSMHDCQDQSEHCPVCKHDIPYEEYLAYMQTNIKYLDLLEKYMDESEANVCWYCWPCL